MAINISREEISFRNKINNSQYFKGGYTSNLLGCVGIDYLVEQHIDLSWDTGEIDSSSWNLVNNQYVSNKLQRKDGGSYLNDGFSIGDIVIFGTTARYEIIPSLSLIPVYAIRQYYQKQLTITNVTETVLTFSENIDFQSIINGFIADPLISNAYITNFYECFVAGITEQKGFLLDYNFVENAEQYDNISIIDNTTSAYFTSAIKPLNEITSLDRFNPSIKSNKKSSDSATIKRIGTKIKQFTIDDVAYTQGSIFSYFISCFVSMPVYKESWLTNIQNNTIPTELLNESSLKFAYKLSFFNDYNQSNTIKSVIFDNDTGNVGWLDEMYNGQESQYQLLSVSYTDLNDESIDSLDIGGCKFTIKIKSNQTPFSSPDNYKRYIYLTHTSLKNASEYENNSNFYNDNLLQDGVYIKAGGTGADGRIFKNLVCNLDTDYEITITGTVDYTYYQTNFPSKIPNEGDLYLLTAVCSTNNIDLGVDYDSTSTIQGSTEQIVNLKVDVNTYLKNTDIPNLWLHDRFEIFDHPTDTDQEGYTGFSGWIEDGIVLFAKKQLKRGAYIQSIKLACVAEKQSDKSYFIIDEFNLDTSEQVFPTGAGAGYTQWNVNTIAGYNLNESDQFNRLIISTAGNASDYAPVSFYIPYKLPWQSWQRLETADTVFYENNPQNEYGLNRNSSRYSNSEGYEVKLYLISNIEKDGIVTEYIDRSPALDLNYYDSPAGFTNEIKTETLDAVDLLGAIQTDKETIIKAVFTKASHGLLVNELYGVIRIEPQRALGNGIFEISTIREGYDLSPLKPITGDYASITVDTNTITVSCKVDNTLLGVEPYRISARIGAKESAPLAGDYNQDYNNDYDNL